MSSAEQETPARVSLRPLLAADLPRVLEIERASFTVPWGSTTFTGMLARSDSDLIAAEYDGELAGYTILWTVVDQAELGNVAVAPAHRGRGIGRTLVEAAMERARRRGATEMFLEVRTSNRAAIELYQRLGFEVVDRRRRYYTRPVEDALVMRVDLH